ncbi:hypothetical protein PAI11_00600 [Patulibacter medicamentivorans]|uniref:Uncharacterized protein n=1 Tax=Patulibacter medicamentivorans TaxID=1097667 RepID=H0DZV5_9ACTN|nr:hypothetical protein [Patulibacter medicamentivorans]EHN13059.1 hypothetical protein PAI11_00600 [Patulibacter medicamentivorans]
MNPVIAEAVAAAIPTVRECWRLRLVPRDRAWLQHLALQESHAERRAGVADRPWSALVNRIGLESDWDREDGLDAAWVAQDDVVIVLRRCDRWLTGEPAQPIVTRVHHAVLAASIVGPCRTLS